LSDKAKGSPRVLVNNSKTFCTHDVSILPFIMATAGILPIVFVPP
jgi:hypothetical protein